MSTPAEGSRKPENSNFKQQRLKAWQPILTPKWVIGTFFVVGLIFIPIGIAILSASSKVVEATIDYSEAIECQEHTKRDQNCKFKNCQQLSECNIKFSIDSDMVAPIYVYYKLDNYYQNHRRYVKSRSDQQRRSEVDQPVDNSCEPDSATKFTPDAKNFPGAEPSNGSKPLTFYPCGLIARSMFNDQFMVYSNEKPTPKLIKWKNKQIAWPSDMESKFKPKDCDWMQKNCANRVVDCEDTATKTQLAPTIYYECLDNPADPTQTSTCKKKSLRENSTAMYPDFSMDQVVNESLWSATWQEIQDEKKKYYCWQDIIDPDFVVWMRTAGLPTFKKLHRIIDTDLAKGTYTLRVNSRYNVAAFNGKKSLVLSTTSWVGGKNTFLGAAYVTVGAICVLLGGLFLAKHMISPRKLGDQKYLVWKQ